MAICKSSTHTSSGSPTTKSLHFASSASKTSRFQNITFIVFVLMGLKDIGHTANRAEGLALALFGPAPFTPKSSKLANKLACIVRQKNRLTNFMPMDASRMVLKNTEHHARNVSLSELKSKALKFANQKPKNARHLLKTLLHQYLTTRQKESSTLGLTLTWGI